jgi:hypothetical protein
VSVQASSPKRKACSSGWLAQDGNIDLLIYL